MRVFLEIEVFKLDFMLRGIIILMDCNYLDGLN